MRGITLLDVKLTRGNVVTTVGTEDLGDSGRGAENVPRKWRAEIADVAAGGPERVGKSQAPGL